MYEALRRRQQGHSGDSAYAYLSGVSVVEMLLRELLCLCHLELRVGQQVAVGVTRRHLIEEIEHICVGRAGGEVVQVRWDLPSTKCIHVSS